MQIKSVEEIIAEIKLRFDLDPAGWKMLRGRDRQGHYDTYIMNRDSLWQLKTEFKNPYQPSGIGVRLPEPPDRDMEILMEVGETLPFGELYPQGKDHPIFAMGIGRYSPQATSELKNIISSRQDDLERDLNENLKKFLHREGICKDYL